MKPLVIIGTGGVGRQVLQIVRSINSNAPEWEVIGFIDDDISTHGELIHNTPVVGGLEWLERAPEVYTVVAIGDPATRKRVARSLSQMEHNKIATLIHPSTEIGLNTSIGKGSIICPGAITDTDVCLKEYVLINKICTIGHDSVIESFVTISPGVNVGGSVTIRKEAFLGIGSSTVQNIVIGERAVIGAGAVVIGSVPESTTFVGVPARKVS